MKVQKLKSQKGITLVALVITIVILLLLAGITIASLNGDNGIFTKVKQAKKAQLESEMREQLIIGLQDLQVEKNGNATLNDVTQDWANEVISKEYNPELKEDSSFSGKLIVMKKDKILGKFMIDLNLNISLVEYNPNSLEFEYETKSRNGDNIEILIKIRDNINGVKQIDCPDKKNSVVTNNKKDYIAIDYTVELGKEYKFLIITGDENKIEKTIKIDDYFYNVTKNLGEGSSIDNFEIKTAYNKAYDARIEIDDNYIMTGLNVTMGGQEVITSGNNVVDVNTGKIKIEKVTGDINITVTTKKLEIQYIVGINASGDANDTSLLGENSQPKGNPLYINIIATFEGNICTVVLKEDNLKGVPYKVISNGKYVFKVSGTYNGKNISEDKEVVVNQYKSAQDVVQYDAGDWTKEEIEELKKEKLYDINKEKIAGDGTFKLNSDSGLNFTFGGFTYKGDVVNKNEIDEENIITSRNESVIPQKGWGSSKYDGWQILESEERDGKKYVKKLVHAGSPENFLYYYKTKNDAYRAEYLLSGGIRQNNYNTLSDGTIINYRKWDMYKDKELDKQGCINNVHIMTYDEAYNITEKIDSTVGIRSIGQYYRLASAGSNSFLARVNISGRILEDGSATADGGRTAWGIRPVVEMNDGVYIKSGSGTTSDPYILGKD